MSTRLGFVSTGAGCRVTNGWITGQWITGQWITGQWVLGCCMSALLVCSGCGDKGSKDPPPPVPSTAAPTTPQVAGTDAADDSTAAAAKVVPTDVASAADVQDKAGESQTEGAAPDDVALQSSAAADWAFFRGDAAGRAYVPQSQLPETLDVLWEYWEPKNSYESSPVVVGDRVVVADLDGAIRCLALREKQLLWKTTTKFGFMASPSICDGRIFIGDNDGVFRCLNLETGAIEWEFQANAQIDSTANFSDEFVIFGSYDSSLYCLRRTDGSLVWKHTTDDQIRCSIVIDGRRTAVAGCDAMLHVIDVSNGEKLTQVELTSQTAVAPSMVGTRAYFGMESGEFVCADMQQEKLVWTWKDDSREAPIRGSAAVTDDRVVFGTRGNQVICLNRESGETLWNLGTKRSVEGSALVVGRRVYVGDSTGQLLVVDLDSGQLLQAVELSGGIASAPALAGDRLIVTTQEGIVYCLGAPK